VVPRSDRILRGINSADTVEGIAGRRRFRHRRDRRQPRFNETRDAGSGFDGAQEWWLAPYPSAATHILRPQPTNIGTSSAHTGCRPASRPRAVRPGRKSEGRSFLSPYCAYCFLGRSIQFRTDINKIKQLVQTTNLGVRSSNLFGRANDFSNLNHILFGDPHDRNGLRTPTADRIQRVRSESRDDIATYEQLRIAKYTDPRLASGGRGNMCPDGQTVDRRLAMMARIC
jgi:hypothetical protein